MSEARSTTEEPFQQCLPSATLITKLNNQLPKQQTADIVAYMKNPSSHPDISTYTKTIPKPGNKPGKPVQTTAYKHVDGFEKLPLYQSSAISIATDLSNRVGKRGVIALRDIEPGTLLMCEFVRHTFAPKPVSDDGTPVPPEVEFIQEFAFDMAYDEQIDLLQDLSSLYPHTPQEIKPKHRQFLESIYGPVINEIVNNLPNVRPANSPKGDKSVTMKNGLKPVVITFDMLLRLVCLVHFNAFPSGLLLHTAMINHDCSPNATKLLISRKEIDQTSRRSVRTQSAAVNPALYLPKPASRRIYSEIRASRFIPQGEEVYISYIPSHLPDMSAYQRRAYLWRQFRFVCTCKSCEADLEQYKHIHDQVDQLQAADSQEHKPNPTTQQQQPQQPETDENQEAKLDDAEDPVDSTTQPSNDTSLSREEQLLEQLVTDFLNLFHRATSHDPTKPAETTDQNATNAADNTTSDNSDATDRQDYLGHDQQHNENDGDDIHDMLPDPEIDTTEGITYFRERYGLSELIDPEFFVLFYLIRHLYPITHAPTADKPLSRFNSRMHRVVAFISRRLHEKLESKPQSISLPSLSLMFYLYMLTTTSSSASSSSTQQQQPPQHVLPWHGALQFSRLTTTLHINETRMEAEKQNPQFIFSQGGVPIISDPAFPEAYAWTVDRLLNQTYQLIEPLLSASSTALDTFDSKAKPAAAAKDDSTASQPSPLTRVLTAFGPVVSNLTNTQSQKVIEFLQLSVTSFGLISTLCVAHQYCVQHQGPDMTMDYNELLFNLSYAIQCLLLHESYSSCILRFPLLGRLLSPRLRDANMCQQRAMALHRSICGLYNQTPIESVVKGI